MLSIYNSTGQTPTDLKIATQTQTFDCLNKLPICTPYTVHHNNRPVYTVHHNYTLSKLVFIHQIHSITH